MLLSAVTNILNGQEPVKVNQDEILLLAHFNSRGEPEIGISDGMVNRGAITAGEQGVKFKDSAPRAEALDLTAAGSVLALPGNGNIDVRQGTIQFWFKPRWNKTGYNHCRIFQFGDSTERGGVNWRGSGSFYFQKRPKQEVVEVGHDSKNIRKELPYNPDAWHQTAATWSKDAGTLEFFLDGELVGTQKYTAPDAPPVELHFGAPDTHRGQVYIDELRILNRPLTAAQIKQDYEAQKGGREFTAPKLKGDSYPVFQPVAPSGDAIKSGLLDIDLPVHMVTSPIAIDGNLDKPCWKQTAPLPALLKKNGQAPSAESEIKLLYDRNNLYIAARFAEPQMDRLSARYDQRDLQIYNDDCLEFVIRTPGKRNNFFHFAVNALGSIYDAADGKRNWNARNADVKTVRGKDYWTVEMKIPFKDFGITPPQIGENWGARFCRERHGADTKESSSVPQVKSGSLSAEAFLGKLRFMGITGEKTTLDCSLSLGKFMPGVNSLTLTAKNISTKSAQYSVSIISYNRKSEVLGREDMTINPAVGQTIELPLKIKVDNDETERIVISVSNAGGTIVYSRILGRAYKAVEPSIRQTAASLPQYQENANAFKSYRHPLYQSVVKSVDLLTEELQDYQNKLNQALKSGQPLATSDYDRIAAAVNGFNQWLETRRYLVWQTSPWENGSPDAIAPLKYQEKPLLRFNLAGNEREAACLVISGLLCDKRMDLRIFPEPIRQGGKFISSDNFRIYIEEFTDHMGAMISAPLVQVPGNIITVTPGHSLRVWVVFDSKGVDPGNYSGTLKIKPLYDYSIPNRDLPVALRVFDFTLPETHDWPLDCFFWFGGLTPLNETAMIRLVHDYHIKWAMTESHNYRNGFLYDRSKAAPRKGEPGYDPELVKSANQEFFDEAKRLKMGIVFAWGTGPDVEWHKLMSDRLLGMGFTYRDFIFHGALKDEFHMADIARSAKLREELKAANPNWQFMATYLTTPPPSGASLKQIEEAGLPDFFKVWSVAASRLFSPKQGPETLETLRKHGCKVWAYRCNLNMQTADLLEYYRFFPWEGYLKGLDGVAYWTFYSARNDGFDHRDGYDDGITWRGVDKQPVPTKRLEVVREGLEDVAYMDILKKRIEAASAKNPKKNYAGYLKLISERPKQIMKNCSQQEIDRWRLEVAEAIEKLGREL